MNMPPIQTFFDANAPDHRALNAAPSEKDKSLKQFLSKISDWLNAKAEGFWRNVALRTGRCGFLAKVGGETAIPSVAGARDRTEK